MNNQAPKVSVIMPVYNREKFIKEAIDSVLAQTFIDFELIVVDDCSTDRSVEIVNSYNDARIKLYVNEINSGPAVSRNLAISKSSGEYIAFLDSDDCAHPYRLAKQVKFMDSHFDYGMLGSCMQNINENGNDILNEIWYFLAPVEEVPIQLLFSNYFATSSVMVRKLALPEILFKKEYVPAEDYELWTRIAENWKIWNLPEILLRYRVHGNNISFTESGHREVALPSIYKNQLKRLGLSEPDNINFHYILTSGILEININNANRAKDWIERLHEANQYKSIYDRDLFFKALLIAWISVCRKLDGSSWFYLGKIFWRTKLLKSASLRQHSISLYIGMLIQPFRKIKKQFIRYNV